MFERNNRAHFRRLLFIHKKIKSGANLNSLELAQEYEVSERTIKRDIEFMREALGAPIVSGGRRKGYSYTDEFFNLPSLFMGEGELTTMLLFEQLLPNYANTPFANTLEGVKKKLLTLLPERVSVHPATLGYMSLRHEPLTPISSKVWEALLPALDGHQILKVSYQSLKSDAPIERQIHPYHLVGDRGAWYLIAFDEHTQEIRMFSLSRIEKIKILKKRFQYPENFSPDKSFDGQFGIFINQELIKVELEYSEEIARIIEERHWHDSQVFKKKGKKRILALETNQITPLIQWILSWGKHITVIKPDSLKKEISKTISEMQKNYKSK